VESAELVAILREVRERVRARYPEESCETGFSPLDLMPLVHARDAVMGKVAAIGTVNPRRGGPVNAAVQAWKRLVARVLDWHVREQVEFNRHVLSAIDAQIEALNEVNRTLAEVHRRSVAAEQTSRHLTREFEDIRNHWHDWRQEWERKLHENEVRFLRNVAELQGAFQHRATLMDASYRDAVRSQHAEFEAAVERSGVEIQKRLWADLERIQLRYEELIHSELRVIRQRSRIGPTAAADVRPTQPGMAVPLDYNRFAERFRGSEEYVRKGQQLYLPYFTGCKNVLDIGCGRGEFLETMREAGIPARGIDLDEESVAACRAKGLDAEAVDLFERLGALPEGSLDGIFCAQVVEHLPAERLPEMVRLCAGRLRHRGVIAIETPNPECLAIFATHFYLDPTHTRPVPYPLMAFYLEESGFGKIEVTRLSPALESIPSLASLPEDFRDAFFGGLDYAITARKLI
jgi:2-polyprenyl-3-methyl-5-hydroxy-6-metoxy-1,4-benzoquinol methylase